MNSQADLYPSADPAFERELLDLLALRRLLGATHAEDEDLVFQEMRRLLRRMRQWPWN